MKSLKFKQMVMIFGLILMLANSAFAKSTKHKGTAETNDSLTYSSSSAESSGSTDTRFGLGYAFADGFTGAMSSVTGIYKFSDRDMLQGYFAIPTTHPFEISGGANYKRTVSESQNAGFHIGGGAAFGSLPSPKGGTGFYFGVDALAGFHFNLSGAPHVQIHVDGGPIFSLTDGTSNFSVSAVSAIFGASLLYWF